MGSLKRKNEESVWYYVSCNKFCCRVDVDCKGRIVGGAPILRKFTGQHIFQLKRWLDKNFSNVEIEKFVDLDEATLQS